MEPPPDGATSRRNATARRKLGARNPVRLWSVEPGVPRDNRGSSRTLIQQLMGRLASSTEGVLSLQRRGQPGAHLGAWSSGQQRSRGVRCGYRNAGVDLAERLGPAALRGLGLTSHGRGRWFETSYAHHTSAQVRPLSSRLVPVWVPVAARRGRAGAAAPSPARSEGPGRF
jgi:hypothetical protein